MMQELKREFARNVARDVKDYVGYSINRSSDNLMIWITQPELISTLKKVEIRGEDTNVDIPARSGSSHMVVDENDIVSGRIHRSYRVIISKFLYLATKSRSKICNAVRKLSKHLDRPSKAHVKTANMAMNFVKNTRDWSYVVEPEAGEGWVLEAMCDSDYSADKDSRLSISGYIVLLKRVATS